MLTNGGTTTAPPQELQELDLLPIFYSAFFKWTYMLRKAFFSQEPDLLHTYVASPPPTRIPELKQSCCYTLLSAKS